MSMSVLLPAPDGPMMTDNSPALKVPDTSLRIVLRVLRARTYRKNDIIAYVL